MSHKGFCPELLAPAGNLEKLKVAVLYGANAVYVGGLKFGLRAGADNFTEVELEEGVNFAHERGTKVYVVLNAFLHDDDLSELPAFIKFLEAIKIDAVIVSDVGVITTISEHTNLEIHLSTQASCLNIPAAKMWKKMGVKRIVVGRELSIKDAGELKRASGLEVEMFIHGSMCMAYSGNCTISNFTQGRDSNRGGCAHSCRFEYGIEFKNLELEKKNAYFMSSKDLAGIRLLEDFIKYEIDSLKVEGRMKSHLYAGTMSKVYAEALAFYKEHGHFLSDQLQEWERELTKVTHRSYTEASLQSPAGTDSIYDEREHNKNEYEMVGRVLEVKEDDFLLLEVRNAFNRGDQLEILPFKGHPIEFKANTLKNLLDQPIERTKPSTLIKIPYLASIEPYNILRKQVRA